MKKENSWIELMMLETCSNIQKSLIQNKLKGSKQHSYLTVKLAKQSAQHADRVTELSPVLGPQNKTSIFLGYLVY